MDNFNLKKYLAEGKLLKESSISKLKDKVKYMSKEDFITLVKKVGDLDKWKNASKGKFDDGTPIKPFSNASDRIEVIDNNFEEKDAEKYLAEGKLLKEEINIDIIDDIAILTGDSGKYEGEIEDDGTVSFSVIFDKQGLDTRIIDQYDESNIDEFLGKDHAFVELSKKYDHNWDIEPDLVGITIKLTEGKLQEF